MYGVPENLPLSRFVGDFLSQVSLGMDGVHFHFGRSGTISVFGRWELHDASEVLIDKSTELVDRDAFRLHGIFNADVLGFSIDAPRSFALKFSTGHLLTIYDDSEQFESFTIQPDNIIV